MIETGKLNRRIEILNYDLTPLFQVWANIRPVTSREMMRNGALISDDLFTIAIRHMSGLNITQKVLYRDRIYNIINISEDYDNDMIIITVTSDGSSNASHYRTT